MSFTIDVHHHILPDIFWRATNDAHSPVGGILPAPWSKESTLSYMDDAGIDVAITSISTPPRRRTRRRGGHASQALLGHRIVVAGTCPADASFSSRHGPGALASI